MTTTREAKKPLSVTHPYLVEEWDYEKNAPLTPDEVTHGVNKKVWWICVNSHSWEASISSRTIVGTGCPYCSNRRALAGFNDLETTNPELAKEWDYAKNSPLTPTDVTQGSECKVWWLCEKGHSWQMAINKVPQKTIHCPYCSNRKVLHGFNDLQSQCPTIAQEWDYAKNALVKPSDITIRDSAKYWWICSKGHSYDAQVNTRVDGRGCPYCSNKRLLTGYNDLLTKHPEIAKEWHPTKNGLIKPENVASQSNKKFWWMCSKGHEWEASPNRRVTHKACPECSKERKTSFPEQVVYYYFSQVFDSINRYSEDKYELDVFLPQKNVGIEYDGRYFHSTMEAQARESRKEKYYSKRQVRVVRIKESDKNKVDGNIVFYNYDSSYNQLPWAIKTVFELIGDPEKVPDINIERDAAKIHDKYITNEKENSFAARFPELLCDWVYEKNIVAPTMIQAGSHKEMWWRCQLGHEWKTSVYRRASGHGCPYCAGQKVLVGFNDFSSQYPELVKEWNKTKNGSLSPTSFTSRSNKKVWWICDKGHEWETSIKARANGHGCSICVGHITKTHDEFTEKLGIVNPDIEVLGEYKNTGTKIAVRCRKCNYKWETTPYILEKGHGCPMCAYKNVADKRRKGTHVFAEELKRIHPDIEVLGEYKNTGTKIAVRCRKCNYTWESVPGCLMKSRGCPKCLGTIRRTHEDFVKELANISPYIEVISKYVNTGSKVDVRCKKCNRTWSTTAMGLLVGYGCVNCKLKQSADRRRRPQEKFVAELREKNPDIEVTGNYVNCDTKILFRCKKCGNEWHTTPYSVLKGHGCPYCSNHRVKSGFNDLCTVNPKLAQEWNYHRNEQLKTKKGEDISTPDKVTSSSSRKVWWICEYGHEWQSTVSDRARGHGCPYCSGRRKLPTLDKKIN